jgi:F0F1-type ATP synthase epsilon subunit
MKHAIQLGIALPAQHLISVEAKKIRVPLKDGYLGIMAGRKPLISAMIPGLVTVTDINDIELLFATTGGFCEICDSQAILLCDSIVWPKDLEKFSIDFTKPFYHTDTSKMSEKQKIEYIAKMLGRKCNTRPETKY